MSLVFELLIEMIVPVIPLFLKNFVRLESHRIVACNTVWINLIISRHVSVVVRIDKNGGRIEPLQPCWSICSIRNDVQIRITVNLKVFVNLVKFTQKVWLYVKECLKFLHFGSLDRCASVSGDISE